MATPAQYRNKTRKRSARATIKPSVLLIGFRSDRNRLNTTTERKRNSSGVVQRTKKYFYLLFTCVILSAIQFPTLPTF